MRTLFGYQNKSVILKIGDKVEPSRILSVVVANGCYFGGGMRVAPQAELGDGLLDFMIVSDIGKLELLKAFPRVYNGTHITHPKVRMGKATRITIESSERECSSMLGDLG